MVAVTAQMSACSKKVNMYKNCGPITHKCEHTFILAYIHAHSRQVPNTEGGVDFSQSTASNVYLLRFMHNYRACLEYEIAQCFGKWQRKIINHTDFVSLQYILHFPELKMHLRIRLSRYKKKVNKIK